MFAQIKCIFCLILLVSACNKNNDSTPQTCDFTNDPDNFFQIEANNDGVFNSFCKKVDVFGISIYAVAEVEDAKLLHAANLMAEFLDNDEDGTIDNQLILDAMLAEKASLVMWKRESDLNVDIPDGYAVQDLGNDETQLVNGENGRFDTALEEVLHIITFAGWSKAYPDAFGEDAGSEVANAMDIARGGHFQNIPNPYPAEAWYTYDDSTCDYRCMVVEYTYWGMTSILGAQAFPGRCDQIDNEWRLCTKEAVETGDVALYEILTNPEYKLPTVLPDGKYRR